MSQEYPRTHSEPEYTKSAEREKFPFYRPNIDEKLVPETRELLEKYSLVPPEEQSEHVHKIRDKAWDRRAYPCIGVGSFLTPQLCKLPVYPEILKRVKEGQTLMDVGCFVGHDLRRLVYDGAPSSNLYGVDIVNYWDVGFEMFRDKDQFQAHFIEADFLSVNPKLEPLAESKVDIISILQVLHQWDLGGQVNAAKALVTFTKPGSLVVGNQIGNETAITTSVGKIENQCLFHNPESFKKLWDQVGVETGTKWETEARSRSFKELGFPDSDKEFLEKGVGTVGTVGFLEFWLKRIE